MDESPGQISRPMNKPSEIILGLFAGQLAEPSSLRSPPPDLVPAQHPLRDSENNYEEYYCAMITHTMGLPRSSAENVLRSTIYPAIWEDAAHGPNERIAWPNWTLGAFMNTKPPLFVQNSNFSHAALIDMIQNNFAFRPQTHYRPAVTEPWNEVYCKENSGKETCTYDARKAKRHAEEMDPGFWNGEWFRDPKNCDTGFKKYSITGLHYWDFELLDARIWLAGCHPSTADLESFDYNILRKNPKYHLTKVRSQFRTNSEALRDPFVNFDGVVELPMSYSLVSDSSFGCIGIGTKSGLEAAEQLAPDSLPSIPARPKRRLPVDTSSASPHRLTPSTTLRHVSALMGNLLNESVYVERLKINAIREQEQNNGSFCCSRICGSKGVRSIQYSKDELKEDLDPGGNREDEFEFPRRSIQRMELFPETLLPEVEAFMVEGKWGEEFQTEKRQAEHAEGLFDGRAFIEKEMEREEDAQRAELRKSIADAERVPDISTPNEVGLGADWYVATYEVEDILAVDDLRKEAAGLTDSEQLARAVAHNKALEKQLRAYHRSHHTRADILKAEVESMFQPISRSACKGQVVDYFLGQCDYAAIAYGQEANPFEMIDIVSGDGSKKRASDIEVMT